MTGPFEVTAIGVVRSTRGEAEDDDWDAVPAAIELDAARFGEECVAGLVDFSHVEVLFLFDRVGEAEIQTGARHPRGNSAWPKVGIFAQRGKMRPNRLGSTVCRLDRLEGLTLHVTGLDAIDGTPVLDVKPYVRELGPRGDMRQPAWITELMKGYWAAPSSE